MTKMLFLGLYFTFSHSLPPVESGFGLLTHEMQQRPLSFDSIRGVNFQGNPIKLPGSVPTEPIRKPGEKGAEAERREILATLLNRPRALLYTEANFTGCEEKYEYRDRPTEKDYRGSCFNTAHAKNTYTIIHPLFPGWKSIKVFSSCVRLFRMFDCREASVAVYPGVAGDHVWIEEDGEKYYPRSVGPCLEHEFKFSSISTTVSVELSIKKDESNYLQIPDQLFDFTLQMYQTLEPIPRGRKLSTVKQIAQEHGPKYNRTKYLFVDFNFIGLHYLESYPGEEIISDKGVKWGPFLQDRKDGDDLGYLIPPKLGGPTEEMYNIFPQSREHLRDWTALTDIIFESFRAKRGQDPETIREFLHITLFYENEETTRPYGIYYHLNTLLAYEGNRIDYGFLYN